MSLEEALNRNTEMLEKLCSIMGSTSFRAADPVGYGANVLNCEEAFKDTSGGQKVKDAETQNVEREIAEAKVPNEKPQDSQKSKPTTDTSKPSSPESPAVTYDDVKKATNAVSAKLGREKAIAGLARFGVQSATKLTEEQWPEYVAYMTRVAAGELDPEAGE